MQNNAKWGKQWGKHLQHFDAFIHIILHHKNMKSPVITAFQRIGVQWKEVYLILTRSLNKKAISFKRWPFFILQEFLLNLF